jgi:hypothetical protein
MKYLAIFFLSLAASLTARTAPLVGVDVNAAVSIPAHRVQLAAPREDNAGDRALAGMVASTLVALQLRRRQKSLTLPRPLI